MKNIDKYKVEFPIGCIIKHKHCDLMYEIVDYKYVKGFKNHCNVLSEHFVVCKILFYPEEEIGEICTLYIDSLREFIISNIEYLDKIVIDRNKRKLIKVEKYEQLRLF